MDSVKTEGNKMLYITNKNHYHLFKLSDGPLYELFEYIF